jgi:hypothetical protein
VKRALIALVASAAVVAPTQAPADAPTYSSDKQAARGGEASVSVDRVTVRRGKPRKIVGEVDGLAVQCTEDLISYGATLAPISVRRNRTFSKNVFFEGARKLHVQGRINRAVSKITGSLRLTGGWPDEVPPLTNCDSGVERFVLTRR